jgi:hypothetical protein
MLLITQHAHQRFLERFPDVPVCLTERVESAILFGGQKGTGEMRFDPDYKMVYVLNKTESGDYVLRTILTLDQAMANFCKLADMRVWRNYALDPKSKNTHDESASSAEDLVKNSLHILASKAVVDYGFVYPDREEVKKITKEIQNEFHVSRKRIEKYFWPEVGRLIYEHNAKLGKTVV